MQRHGVTLTHLAQDVSRLTAVDHEVFRDHFDEVDGNPGFEERVVMLLAQSETITCECRWWREHAVLLQQKGCGTRATRVPPGDYFGSVSEPPAARHALGVLTTTPWPLQLFRP